MALEKTNLSEQAYRLLTERILNGKYPAGTRLTEEALAAEFGISRTPLREALRRLTTEGLLEALPKRGLRVTSPTEAEIAELFECRSMIEPPALACSGVLRQPFPARNHPEPDPAERPVPHDADLLDAGRAEGRTHGTPRRHA